MRAKPYRLPHHTRPLTYDVDISTSPNRSDFSGRVKIAVEISKPTPVIEMHSRDLSLGQATVRTAGGEPAPLEVELDPDHQVVRFRAQRPLGPGAASLEVEFTGRPNPSMHGLYLATDGKARAMCTQCEATDARAIFPCFDEPEFKARIQWTVRTEPSLVALSNGELAGTDDVSADERAHRFAPTGLVSSYLAALCVGDLEGTPAKTVQGTPLRVWAVRGKLGQTGFALDYTARLLPWYEEYFAIPYPFVKYDQVAVPGFDAGAMENVGLVLFRQNLLLMDPGAASWRQEKLIAKVIAHEFAHMWFGNLVTMKWWDDLWLNEAFAEWMAHKAVDALSPDYRVWEDFQDDKNRALVDDALPATHPIWTQVETPDQAIEMFDVITYQKGCAVMRMLEHFLGAGPFRDGLRQYMKQFANGNAAGADLWRALEDASRQPVEHLMRSWIGVSGFPLLSVTLDGSNLQLNQKRFFSGVKHASAPNDQLWNAPVVVRYEDSAGVHEHRFIFADRSTQVTLPAQGEIAWCYANAKEIGFYRMQPDAKLRRALLDRGLPKLDPIEQMGFLEDQWALVRNATETIDSFLEVLGAFAGEGRKPGESLPIEDHNVLRACVDRLDSIDRLLEDSGNTEVRAQARRWIESLFLAHLHALGYSPRPGEAQNDLQRRALLIHTLAKVARNTEAIDACTRFAELERGDPKAVDPNLAGTFLDVAATVGDSARYDGWVQTYRQRKDSGAPPQVTLRYLYTLASFRPEELTRRSLGLIEDGTIAQEAVGPVIGQLLGQRHAQELAWGYVQSHWQTLRTRVGDMGISRVVEAVGGLRPNHRGEIVAFFEKNPPAGAERALARALEFMDEREELRERVTPKLIFRFSARVA